LSIRNQNRFFPPLEEHQQDERQKEPYAKEKELIAWDLPMEGFLNGSDSRQPLRCEKIAQTTTKKGALSAAGADRPITTPGKKLQTRQLPPKIDRLRRYLVFLLKKKSSGRRQKSLLAKGDIRETCHNPAKSSREEGAFRNGDDLRRPEERWLGKNPYGRRERKKPSCRGKNLIYWEGSSKPQKGEKDRSSLR